MKRLGVLKILESEYTLELAEAMPKMRVHRVEYQPWNHYVEIICECQEFEIVPDGCVPYEYSAFFEADEDEIIFKEFTRV